MWSEVEMEMEVEKADSVTWEKWTGRSLNHEVNARRPLKLH